MSTPQFQPAPQAPQITTTSPAGHTTAIPTSPPAHHNNVAVPPAAATIAPAPNAPMTTLSSTASTQDNPNRATSTDLEPLTYNEQLNAADRLWKFKMALTTILVLVSIVGIGCIAWALSTANRLPSGYDYGYDSSWSLPWGLITFSISIVWCILCIILVLTRKRPVHPGVRVTMDLLLWLGFLVTALFTMYALFDLLQWGEYGTLDYSSGWSSRYGDYVLQKNNTWVWEQDSGYSSVTYERTCNGSSSTYNYYYTDLPFQNCAEMDAYVNQLWQEKPNRARVELTGVVCQFLGIVLHFALFVWACVDCHKHRHSKVSKDAEKIAAGIVEKMVQNGAIVPPPGQAHMRSAGWQPTYHQLPSRSSASYAQGQGYHGQAQQHPIHASQMTSQQGMSQELPLPPLPPRPHQASTDKAGNVAASYYEPAR